MDVMIGYFSIPAVPDDSSLWLWYHTVEGRSASLRPGKDGRTMVLLTIQKPSGGEHRWSAERQKAMLLDRFADAGSQVPRILEGLIETDWFYFDTLRQIRMTRWSKGRVVLTGDAAWCATPLAGIGTTLALVGAYVLAAEITRAREPEQALAKYEEFMRPIVEKKQNVPKILPRLLNPHTRAGLVIIHSLLRFMGLPGIRRVAGRLFLGASFDVKLPPAPDTRTTMG